MKLKKAFLILLSTVFSSTLSQGQTYTLSAQEIKNIRLAYDSLDEMREICDSMRSQVNSALQVIQADDTVIKTLHSLNFNQGEIISGKDIQLKQEQRISSSYRRKSRLYSLLLAVSIALNAYQIVR